MAETPFRHDAEASPGFLLWQLTSRWQARIATALQRFGLTQTQHAILASLRWLEEHGGPPTQSRLAEQAQIEKMTLSKAIRRLEEDGLVARLASARDARATEVALTASGTALTGEAIRAVEEADEAFFAALDGPARQAWMAHTRTLIGADRAAISDEEHSPARP